MFGALNLVLYWIARPLLDLATLRTFTMLMPLVVNSLILWGTARIVQKRAGSPSTAAAPSLPSPLHATRTASCGPRSTTCRRRSDVRLLVLAVVLVGCDTTIAGYDDIFEHGAALSRVLDEHRRQTR